MEVKKNLIMALNLVSKRAHVQLSNAPYQDTIARTTKKKELQQCSKYMEIATIYESSWVDERDLSSMV